jgi:hypothetical protein
VGRRPLPRILSSGTARITRGRDLARTAADHATDVLHPLITVSRGLRRLAGLARARWADTPREKRGPTLFTAALCLVVVAFIPYGPLTALIALMGAAAWHGRMRTPAPSGPSEAEAGRLQSLYDALVPYFSVPEDPAPLYRHGGDWESAVTGHSFGADGRPDTVSLRYPAYFTDAEPESRARVEALLRAKCGRGREYRFGWDEEENRLTMEALPALPVTVAAQRFVTAPGETVLGFTDAGAVPRTLPVSDTGGTRDAAPVLWRTGHRSAEPHLLVAGTPGSGTTTLLRSVALQALRHGDVLVVEGGGAGEYACLAGRPGVLAVECTPAGALTSLTWAARETERRLVAANRARQAGRQPAEDTRRPLWILVDRPALLGQLAAAEGRPDPQELLRVPLRHGRAAQVTVVVAEHAEQLAEAGRVPDAAPPAPAGEDPGGTGEPPPYERYSPSGPALPGPGHAVVDGAVLTHTRARVALGPLSFAEVAAVLGAEPGTTPAPEVPPGRGYARIGPGPVLRVQVPATPDPYDEATPEALRLAVLELLPERPDPAPGEASGSREAAVAAVTAEG